MLTARVYSVEEAYQLAIQLERQTTTKRYQYQKEGTSRSNTNTAQKPVDIVKGGIVSDSEGKAKAFGEGPQCFKCRGFGHFTVVCPTRDQRVAYICKKELELANEEGIKTESDTKKKYEEPEEERLKATDLPLCVVKRILTGNKGQSEHLESDWKRTNIFHTWVVHGNKALNVIIDNGSGMNVISKEATERLGLP